VRVGETLADRFVLEERAAAGGIGEVYKAWDLEAERPAAVKLLSHLRPHDLKRFEREAAVLAGAGWPGIVRHVHHGLDDDGAPYLVMEWLDGVTVARHMEDRGFDVAGAVALVAAVCRPLGELHARGLVHRDLKPENLVMTSERPEDVVLIDLGLARSTSGEAPRVTATGYILGTPGYMSPEQVRGDALDARSDVFALGCVLYEALTGYAAFGGENRFAVRVKVLLATPADLRSLCPAAPVELADLVARMLAKPVAERPADAREVGALLARLPAMPRGAPRAWHTAPASTELVPARAAWTCIVLIRSGEALDLADLVAAHGGRLECAEDGLATVIHAGADRVAAARAAARLAFAVHECSPSALVVITSGEGALEAVIERSARALDANERATVIGRRPAAIEIDEATSALLAGELEVDGRRAVRLR
jgi:hypothetical protein